MRICPKCGKIYSDPNINFCLNDGELLSRKGLLSEEEPKTIFADDSPDTILLDETRVTNPIGFPSSIVPVPTQQYHTPVHQPQVIQYGGYRANDQTVPIVSFILGICSIVAICCFGGFYFGIPAAILGLIGMSNVNKNPEQYGGKGFAITGIVLGLTTFIFAVLHILLAIIA